LRFEGIAGGNRNRPHALAAIRDVLGDAPIDWTRYSQIMQGRRIPSLKKFQGRNPNGYFQDLSWPIRQRAYRWLHHLCAKGKRERGAVPQWLFALNVGQAKRLALNPPGYQWSRWMNAKKRGYAVQRKYRREGRHPTEAATRARLIKNEARRREELGLPEPTRHRFLTLD
jgi:hypothetical protein